MISMKRIVFLFFNIITTLIVSAQRDFQLVENQNFWLTSGNSASLTTFNVPTISTGNIFYNYSSGSLRGDMQGSHNNQFGVDAQSYYRINDKLVVYGNVIYDNNYASNLAGSMFLTHDDLKPFDLVEATDENIGSKRYEFFNIDGAVGWKITNHLSLGAKFDFTAGTYAKYRDLRHTNTLMDIDARANLFWNFSGLNGVGASFIYKRRSETMKFETFGTTDKVFKTLVDYANGYGEIETYGGDGFTDSSNETPMYNQYFGVGLQGGLIGLYGEIDYLHRSGYYGKKSQYTVNHSDHSSNIFRWKVRYVLPEQRSYLCMFEIGQTSEVLSSFRTNYRKETMEGNGSVTYYEYYEPTKISDKAMQAGYFSFKGYWKPVGDIYLWYANANVGYVHSKQSAYLFPSIYTERFTSINPEVTGRRSFFVRDTDLLSVELVYGMQFKFEEQLNVGVNLKYELGLHNKNIRPWLLAGYSLRHGIGDEIKNLNRNSLYLMLGITF